MTPRAVVDASAALHLVMDGRNAGPIADRLEDAHLVTAPDLFTCEVARKMPRYWDGNACGDVRECVCVGRGRRYGLTTLTRSTPKGGEPMSC